MFEKHGAGCSHRDRSASSQRGGAGSSRFASVARRGAGADCVARFVVLFVLLCLFAFFVSFVLLVLLFCLFCFVCLFVSFVLFACFVCLCLFAEGRAQGLKQEEVLMAVDAKRLLNLKKRRLLRTDTVLHLDWRGELIPVLPKAVPLDPVSGSPLSLVLCRVQLSPQQMLLKQQSVAGAAMPDPLLPLGWHKKD
jgi:hypothetical protein